MKTEEIIKRLKIVGIEEDIWVSICDLILDLEAEEEHQCVSQDCFKRDHKPVSEEKECYHPMENRITKDNHNYCTLCKQELNQPKDLPSLPEKLIEEIDSNLIASSVLTLKARFNDLIEYLKAREEKNDGIKS